MTMTTMTLKILQIGESVLRQRARALEYEEIHSNAIQDLIALIKQTMEMRQRVGLAAPQIGVSIQLVLIEELNPIYQGYSS